MLGQNVNAWQDRESGLRLDGLLAELAQIEALNACDHHQPSRDMDAALIAAQAQCQINAYLHLPVQSGSPHIEGNEPPSHARAIS